MIKNALDNHISVLIVDDQRTMRLILRDLLHGIGVREIHEAENGEAALDILHDHGLSYPDLVICDLHMEKMDGMEFCNTVRRSDQLRDRHVPIVILTGDQNSLVHEVSRQVGATKVMTKPINAMQLKNMMAEGIGFSLEIAQ